MPDRASWLLGVVQGIAVAWYIAQSIQKSQCWKGITKHLKILEEANLVMMKKEGRDSRYTLSPQPLAEAIFGVTTITEQ